VFNALLAKHLTEHKLQLLADHASNVSAALSYVYDAQCNSGQAGASRVVWLLVRFWGSMASNVVAPRCFCPSCRTSYLSTTIYCACACPSGAEAVPAGPSGPHTCQTV
jgi:hypothetical protein